MIKGFTIQVIVRVLLILLCCILFAYLIPLERWFTVTGTGALILIQIVSLIKYVNTTNYSLVKFLDALKNEDYSVYFAPANKGDSFARVYEDFNHIIRNFKKNKIDKQAQFEYFKQILEQVNLGILSIKKEMLFSEDARQEILFFNRAAGRILGQPQHKYWHRLSKQVPWLETEVKKLSEGGKALLEMESDTEEKQLSLEVIDFSLLGVSYLLITFQDIRSEIEQKEIEAWHNVIRILAHEMLNSFTPVSSLASTIKKMTEDKEGNIIHANDIDDEAVRDIHLAAKTIQKRSDGLLVFVKDYRTISNVPLPIVNPVQILVLLENISRLMQASLDEHGIELSIENVPSKAMIHADEKLIEQVFLNILGNSVYALEEVADPKITITAEIKNDRKLIHITDNGKGIDPSIMNQIFIPFYTTRKNGSGIGLSLSKNIMKKHGGGIRVSSEPFVATTFSLVFVS
ncbi:GHKL domain-containing protein [Leptobacterium flavescens]|uniref:histidine kinase n=1 Tax=Leptobacterium flavescens TaxID=472055 RepID=A0A6P0UMW8_9FLAO|nr:ATP-binding protein [Leptobacterium flavescens]NER14357.1 GHKL domain-containing protein [Leptobacterium flavescens]